MSNEKIKIHKRPGARFPDVVYLSTMPANLTHYGIDLCREYARGLRGMGADGAYRAFMNLCSQAEAALSENDGLRQEVASLQAKVVNLEVRLSRNV